MVWLVNVRNRIISSDLKYTIQNTGGNNIYISKIYTEILVLEVFLIGIV